MSFWENGVKRQETAKTLVEANQQFQKSCDMCWFKSNCCMRTDKYGISQIEKCRIYQAHEKRVKEIVRSETQNFIIYAETVNIGK